MRLNFSSSGKALPDLRKDINAGGTSSVPEVSSSRRLPSSNSSSAFSGSVSATRAFTGFFPLSLLGQRRCIWPFWWQWKHSTVLRQFVDSSSALAVRPLVPFFQLLLDRVLSARVSIAFRFGVGILTPRIVTITPYLSRDTTYCYRHCKGISRFPLLPYHPSPRPMPDRITSASSTFIYVIAPYRTHALNPHHVYCLMDSLVPLISASHSPLDVIMTYDSDPDSDLILPMTSLLTDPLR